MFMAFLQTRFQTPSSSGSLVIAIKLKYKCTLHSTAMLFDVT